MSEGACLDCNRKYGDSYGFPDLIVSDDVWEEINPRSNGAGLLCPSCICARAHAAGIESRGAEFRSGPFMVNNDGPFLDHVREAQADAWDECFYYVTNGKWGSGNNPYRNETS